MTDEDLALFTSLDNLGTWITIDDGPAASREKLVEEFQGLVHDALAKIEDRNGRGVWAPQDFEALVQETESRTDLVAFPMALDGARILLLRFEGEAQEFARRQSEAN